MPKKRQPKQAQALTTHKIPAKFAEYAESYCYQIDPNSTIAKLVGAAKDGQDVSKKIVLKGIEKVEEMRDNEVFRAMKDQDCDDTPSKSVTQMLRLLKQSLTVTASGEPIGLSISETASFKEFLALKVPGGRDTYSSMRLPQLIAALGEDEDKILGQIVDTWKQNKDPHFTCPLTNTEIASVLRWLLRGLSITASVRKVWINCIADANSSNRKIRVIDAGQRYL